MYKASFFDLDETLINAEEQHAKADRQEFTSFGIDFDEIEKRTKHNDFFGMRFNEILKIQCDAMKISEKELPLSVITKKRELIFLELVKREAIIIEEAKELIHYAKERGIIVAIVSSGTHKYISLFMKLFDLKNAANFIVGEEDVTRGKPFPDCYLIAYEKLQKIKKISKKECLVIEDAPNGIKAAKAAGLPVCYIPSFSAKEEFDVELKLNSLTELTSVL